MTRLKQLHLILAALLLFALMGCSNEALPSEGKPKEVATEKTEAADQQGEEEDPLTLEAAFFNEVKEVDGKKVIQNPTNFLSLVNKEFFLAAEYEPEDLVRPKVAFSFGDEDIEKSYLRKEAAEALEKMFAKAEKEGIYLFAVSGYRSYHRQESILHAEIEKVGEEKALEAVAPPGSSEHQSGLSMDISSESVQFQLTEEFGEKKEGKWLRENAHHFGFILRYPKGKEDITKYKYEPWHFRYVGKEAAIIIYENDWTLEEFFHNVKKI